MGQGQGPAVALHCLGVPVVITFHPRGWVPTDVGAGTFRHVVVIRFKDVCTLGMRPRSVAPCIPVAFAAPSLQVFPPKD